MNQPLSAPCCRWASMLCPVVTIAAVALIATTAYLVGRNQTLADAVANPNDLLAKMPTMMIDGKSVSLVDAAGAVRSEKFSIATGPVADDSEGLFMLDHNSGLLQCQVIYPRLGQVGARFQVNVAEALGTGGKGGEYLMLTGRVEFPRNSSRAVAPVVVYVMDTATGQYVCYGVPFNSSMVNSGQPQSNTLALITTGSANPLIDRNALR